MIPIKNIYYMLAYAFNVLHEKEYKKIMAEEFNNAADLCSEILILATTKQIKQGLDHAYISNSESLSTLKGKINITESIKTRQILIRKMICNFDEFSENSYLNKILKTTFILLLTADIERQRKRKIKALLGYFHNVDTIDYTGIKWNFTYNRNNKTYELIVSICYLIIKGLLQTTTNGKHKMLDYFDEQKMSNLYEKFILGFYKKEFPEIETNAAHIDWALDDDNVVQLPIMRSDITLSKGNRILIIDAKYHENNLQNHYDKYTIHSRNLYQIFTYVKNKQSSLKKQDASVSGMLLYAKTDMEFQPNSIYKMSGNIIEVRTLDLNNNFDTIKDNLTEIANRYILQ